ncbi:MAG: tyrosine-type recombinase/integrase, partial [Gammaproteobacteria bacterium]|nr:tyrosine-type recombinase/integrase [Gammaproteobacteria bacterium]
GWAMRKGIPAFPADPAQVAAYLAERIAKHGHKPATLRVAAAAIAFVHRIAGWDNPCARPQVKRTLRGATRKEGRAQKQAEALTAEALEIIRETACRPRLGRGGKLESPQAAERRGTFDIALISLMRDGMLRVSEAAALTWADLHAEADGTGRLSIRRSKTDPEGEGAVAFVSAPTMAVVNSMRHGALETDSIFRLRPNQLSKRIKRAAQAAGLGDGFSGHSPRVGMARDLARAGIELPSLMTAGRWRTPVMPAHYIRNETAAKGAVAQLYGRQGRTAHGAHDCRCEVICSARLDPGGLIP